MKYTKLLSLILLLSTVIGCSSVYYSAWEKLGKYKRDLFQDTLHDVRDDQVEVKKEFKDALTSLEEAYGAQNTDVKKAYTTVKSAYDEADRSATTLKNRVTKLDTIAHDLFAEWEKETSSISDTGLRAKSAEKLGKTRGKYRALKASLDISTKKLEPVLTKLRDYTLYLKHSLNAEAIGSLEKESSAIKSGIAELLQQMQRSVQDTEEFIEKFE